MIKIFFSFLFFLPLILIFSPKGIFAQTNSFISVVNPIRGGEFWDLNDQSVEDAVLGQIEILKNNNLPATWLIRFDALENREVLEALKKRNTDEKGLFLEVTPSWAKEAGVSYHFSKSWHDAANVLLTGYEVSEREKLIDASFNKFKEIFGAYPKSVGAWWIDANSLSYMLEKYDISNALIVADQYTTDNYQIWGQFWSTPYYPAKNNAIHPAQTLENKLPVVITQWAARDPVNGYGNGVIESTFSVQANDYIDYHNLNTNYFSKLIDIYTKQNFNKFSHLVVGLENSYSWDKYSAEYKNQIESLVQRQGEGQLSIITLENFASWYQKTFPLLSPEHIIVADDPLGSFKKTVWFMNSYYRAGWFLNSEGSVFRDVRQYSDGEEELCFSKRCDEVNFATFAARVLDEVSFGHKLILDEGKISDFKVRKAGEKYLLSYKNEIGKERVVEFLTRDIGIDGKTSSIDTFIFEGTRHQQQIQKKQTILEIGSFKWSVYESFLKIIKFLGFLIIGCLIPAYLLINKVLSNQNSFFQKAALSVVLGFVLLMLLFYLLSLMNLKPVLYLYLLINLILGIKYYRQVPLNLFKIKERFNILVIGLISLGVVFQLLPSLKNGLSFPYGLGFWGPNSHDGLWHVSLINQLIKGVPPENPIFAGEVLKNYHYFFDLLVSSTSYLTAIPVLDLLFRFFPPTFSITLGVLTYYLVKSLFKLTNDFKSRATILFSLYLVYFSGSFGWIVEFIKFKHWGGESAFWANQSISFNLNPPFALSLIIVVSLLQLLPYLQGKISIIVFTILAGTLISVKAYAGVLILLSLFSVSIFKKDSKYLLLFFLSFILSAVLFLPNFSTGVQLIIFSPFWLIHSMIDSPDRVGWTRLTLARVAGLEHGNWFKFLSAEIIGLAIFIVGNLGMRVFALFGLVKIKSIINNSQSLFVFLFTLFALFIPIFFIQAGNPWNTIQFIYYFLYISALLGGFIFASILVKLSKFFTLPVLIVFIILTPINSWTTAKGYLVYNPHAYISEKEYEALEFLKSQKDGAVLTFPYDPRLKNKIAEPWPLFVYDSTAYVSALGGKTSYIEDEPQNQILLTDYKKRILAAKDFFVNPSDRLRFLEEKNIVYIYLPKLFNQSIEESSGIKNIFENSEVTIFQRIDSN